MSNHVSVVFVQILVIFASVFMTLFVCLWALRGLDILCDLSKMNTIHKNTISIHLIEPQFNLSFKNGNNHAGYKNPELNQVLYPVQTQTSNNSTENKSYFPHYTAQISTQLQFTPIRCPSRCVTFEPFGRFNNNLIQLQNMVQYHLSNNESGNVLVTSIVLHQNLYHYFSSNFDEKILQQLCIFPKIRNKTNFLSCRQIAGDNVYYGKFKHEPTWKDLDKDRLLMWLMTKAISRQNYQKFQAQLKVIPKSYVAIHARFLEGSCEERHLTNNLSTQYCNFETSYLADKINSLGAKGKKIIIFWDGQEKNRVRKAAQSLDATISHQTITVDMLLMIHSNYFIGNKISTVSLNVYKIRLLYGFHASSLLL